MASISEATPPADEAASSSVEGWLRRHPRRVLATLAGAAVFIRLILCLQVAGGPLPQIHALWAETDNFFYDAWGKRVAAGDLLQRAPWHPMARWMDEVAADALANDPALPARLGLSVEPGGDQARLRARLWDHWAGGATFFQEPAYAYLVGLTYRLTGLHPWHVFAWQLALGVAGVLLVHALARRLYSHQAAAAAGLLALLAPIPLFYEVTLLRDSVVACVTLALALLMHWAVEGPRRKWLVLGLAFGAAALLKQTFYGFPILLAAWRLLTVSTPARPRLAAAGLTVLGMALALLPLVLRNLAVGVPALAMSGSAISMLPLHHTSGATALSAHADGDYVRILSTSGGSMVRSLIEAARTHASLWGFVGLELKKAAFAWHGFEAPNNVDFYLFRQGAPVLWFLPARLPLLLPLAVVAVLGAPRRAWPLLVALAVSMAALIVGAVLSRYRAAVVAALLPLAGAGLVQLGAWARGLRWRWLGAAALSTTLYLAWATGQPSDLPDRLRATQYRAGAEWFAPSSSRLAVLHLLEAERLMPGSARQSLRLGELLLASGEAEDALPWLEAGLAAGGTAEQRLLRVRALALAGRRTEALASVESLLVEEPNQPAAVALRDSLFLQSAGAGGSKR